MTYRRPKTLARTLRRLQTQTLPPEMILVVDNGQDDETRTVSSEAGSTVVYRAMTGNLGPAGAAAFGLQYLCREGFDWIHWSGDDGPPDRPDLLERILRFGRDHENDMLAAAAASGMRWNWATGEPARMEDHELRGPVEVDVIPGGSVLVVRREAAEAIGWPMKELFWGMEDYEYCLRMRSAGFRLLADGDLMRERREAAGRLGLRRRRSPLPRQSVEGLPRSYYTLRNTIYVMRRLEQPGAARRHAVKGLMRAVAAWLRGPRFGAAHSRIQWRAIRDAHANRMGYRMPLVNRFD